MKDNKGNTVYCDLCPEEAHDSLYAESATGRFKVIWLCIRHYFQAFSLVGGGLRGFSGDGDIWEFAHRKVKKGR